MVPLMAKLKVIIIISIMIFNSLGSYSLAEETFDGSTMPIYRPITTMKIGLEDAYSEISELIVDTLYYKSKLNGKTLDYSEIVWKEYGILSLGSPQGGKRIHWFNNIYNLDSNQSEYLGETFYGDLIPNPYYTPDYQPEDEIMGRWVWMSEPENSHLISYKSKDYKDALKNHPDQKLKEEFVTKLLEALDLKYSNTPHGDVFNIAKAQEEIDEKGLDVWLDRAGVVLPPTSVSRGVVTLWHSNGAYYTSVVLDPLYQYTPEFKISYKGTNYNDSTLSTSDSPVTMSLINQSDISENDEVVQVDWYLVEANGNGGQSSETLLYSDTNTYTKDTIHNSKCPLIIQNEGPNGADSGVGASTSAAVRMALTMKRNKEVKSVTHTVTISPSSPVTPTGSVEGGAVVIGSNRLGSENYDVTKGIPTGESLYVQVKTDSYILGYNFVEKTGSSTYTATITGNYDKGGGIIEAFSETRSVSRSYQYWDVESYYLYDIEKATVENYGLEGGAVALTPPSSYNISISHQGGSITSSPSSENTNVGLVDEDYNFSTKANNMIDSYSTRDGYITITGIGSGQGTSTGTTGSSLTIYHNTSQPIAPKTTTELYDTGYSIEKTLANQANTQTSAIVTYNLVEQYNSSQPTTMTIPLTGNTVTYHTPVVCYPVMPASTVTNIGIGDREDSIQLRSPNTNKEQLIIGETFDISYPLSGSHLNIMGYGNRNYSATTYKRQIQFTFDVYLKNSGSTGGDTFLKAGTWHDYVVDGEDYTTINNTYYIPHWNQESQTAMVLFRTIPINYQTIATDGYGYNQNSLTTQYKAVETMEVELSSRVYDFTITDITDPNWESHFKTKDPITNESTGNLDASLLPAGPGKNEGKGYEDYSIKLGYETKFSLKTNGDMTGKDDVMVITPTYYHLDNEGRNRQAVDVYYESKNGFIALGSAQDTMKNMMVLNKEGRGLKTNEISETAKVLAEQNRANGYTQNKYYEALSGPYEYNIKWEDKLLLTEMQKTYIGETIKEDTQKWYGEFYLPSQSVFVPKGTNLSSYETLKVGRAPFITDGYIIVNFKIDVYHNISTKGDIRTKSPYISYNIGTSGTGSGSGTNQNGNMWAMEGYNTTYNYGDVMVYYVNKRASDDYN